MSFKVLILPEDPTWNGYILRPLIERMMRECGRPRAIVTVLNNPVVHGVEQAIGLLKSNDFVERYRYFDLVLFLPDGDCVNPDRARSLMDELRSRGVAFVCCPAIMEVEVWLMAGHADRLGASWSTVRGEASSKERFFLPFLEQYGETRAAGRGRKELMQQTLSSFEGLLARCPELAELKTKIVALLDEKS